MDRIKRNVQYVLLGVIVVLLARASAAQEFLPSPPPDRALVYVLDEQNRLVALPFEKGQTPLHPEKIAGSTKISYVELKGEHSAHLPDRRRRTRWSPVGRHPTGGARSSCRGIESLAGP